MIDTKLITFIEVVKHKSYTKAAQALHLSQPAISQHMKALENYYGYKLIEHNNKIFQLTKQGVQVYQYANLLLQNDHLFELKLKNSKQTLCIGATLSIADYYLQDMFTSDLFQKYQLQVQVYNTEQLLENLQEGSLHCAFIEGEFNQNIYDSHLFLEEDMCAFVTPDHPLLKQRCQINDLLDYPLLIREEGSGTRKILQRHLELYNIDITQFVQYYEMGSIKLIKQLLKNENAISFMYQNTVEKHDGLVKLSIQHFSIKHAMHFIYLKNSIQQERYVRLFKQMKGE